MLISKNSSGFTHLGKFVLRRNQSSFVSLGILIVWILALGDVKATPDCQDVVKLVEEVERCIDPLHLLSNISAIGSLNRQQWSSTCRSYHNSMQCLQEMHQRCDIQESLDLDTDLQSFLKAGLGELCVNTDSFVDPFSSNLFPVVIKCEDYFYYPTRAVFDLNTGNEDAYQRHEECFLTHTNGVKACKETFFVELDNLLENMSKSSPEESKQRICSRYNIFQNCIVDALSGPCGKHAAQLYCGLFNAQVPVHILSMCNINPEKSRQTGESQRSGGCIFTSHLLPWLLYGILMVKAIL